MEGVSHKLVDLFSKSSNYSGNIRRVCSSRFVKALPGGNKVSFDEVLNAVPAFEEFMTVE